MKDLVLLMIRAFTGFDAVSKSQKVMTRHIYKIKNQGAKSIRFLIIKNKTSLFALIIVQIFIKLQDIIPWSPETSLKNTLNTLSTYPSLFHFLTPFPLTFPLIFHSPSEMIIEYYKNQYILTSITLLINYL